MTVIKAKIIWNQIFLVPVDKLAIDVQEKPAQSFWQKKKKIQIKINLIYIDIKKKYLH